MILLTECKKSSTTPSASSSAAVLNKITFAMSGTGSGQVTPSCVITSCGKTGSGVDATIKGNGYVFAIAGTAMPDASVTSTATKDPSTKKNLYGIISEGIITPCSSFPCTIVPPMAIPLSPTSSYQIRAFAVNSEGLFGYSETATVTTP